jgi:surface antigen
MATYMALFDTSNVSALIGIATALNNIDGRLRTIAGSIDTRDNTMASLSHIVKSAASGISPISARARAEGELIDKAVAEYMRAEHTSQNDIMQNGDVNNVVAKALALLIGDGAGKSNTDSTKYPGYIEEAEDKIRSFDIFAGYDGDEPGYPKQDGLISGVLCQDISQMSIDDLQNLKGSINEVRQKFLEYYNSLTDKEKALLLSGDIEKRYHELMKQLDEKMQTVDAKLHWSNAANSKETVGGVDSYPNFPFKKGECTWYAYGRFKELFPDTDLNNPDYQSNANNWMRNNADNPAVEIIRDPAGIRAPCIAVKESGEAGHVIIVEYVVYDNNGNPKEVFITECNRDENHIYTAGESCVVKVPYDKFIKDRAISGFIAPK